MPLRCRPANLPDHIRSRPKVAQSKDVAPLFRLRYFLSRSDLRFSIVIATFSIALLHTHRFITPHNQHLLSQHHHIPSHHHHHHTLITSPAHPHHILPISSSHHHNPSIASSYSLRLLHHLYNTGSPPIHTIYSLPLHYPFIYYSPPTHLLLTSYSPIHLLTTCSTSLHPIHPLLTTYPETCQPEARR
jgi:hypothetical protein